ncbi:MAG: ribose 5-phosphate isomerase B [Christensenellales bacterium]|jgi:ribose 5-phosphate isomerase B
MKIAFGSDHAGFSYRELLMEHARDLGHEVIDMGVHAQESSDYPRYGYAVGRAVARGEAERGIVVCGTGFGISLAANRIRGIRCVNATEELTVSFSRRHNDANMLALGERVIGKGKAISLMDIFLTTAFEGGRHEARVHLIDSMEEQ